MTTNAKYIDGDYSEATPCSAPVFESAFEHTTEKHILRQDWCQDADLWQPLGLSSQHPDFSDYILVSEGPHQDLGAGAIKWERVYARIPETFVELAGNIAYQFIGFWGANAVHTPFFDGREPFTRNVPCQVTRDFYLTDDPDTIAIIPATRYYSGANDNFDLTYLGDSPPYYVTSVPSPDAYEDLINDDAFNLVAEASAVTRWMGNIWMRETKRVKAQ